MNKEEKEAIEELKKVRWNSLAVVVKNEEGKMDISYFTEKHKKTLLNLIQKQEKIIDKMAEQFYNLYRNVEVVRDSFNMPFGKFLKSKEEVIEYFKKEVEKDEISRMVR